MRKKRSVKKFLAVFGALLALSAALPVWAALAGKTIEVFTGVTIYVDGVEMKPTDANGKEVETFIYNGTTYVPLRAVSQSLGKAVNYDSNSKSVYIGAAPGVKQYLLSVCPPYQKDGFDTPSIISMASKKYANGCIAGSPYREGFALFNLNGQYRTLSFDAGHIDGAAMENGTFNIYLDNELAFSLDLEPNMMPTHYDVPLHGALQMKFEGGGWSDHYGIANIEIN